MVHIYCHSWPIRWGDKDESKMVKVYSNCPRVELFVNGTSWGVRERRSQDFPAAGLHWLVTFKEGENQLKAVGRKDGVEVTDELQFHYQTERWGQPARLVLQEIGRNNDTVTVQVLARDKNGILCLDARNFVQFGLAGDGRLIHNLGTSTGSRKVQLYNGRALIRVKLNNGDSVLSASSEGMPTAFLTLGAGAAGRKANS